MLVIHHFDLEALAGELPAGCEVRVESLRRVEETRTQGVSDEVHEVHVRAANFGTIYTWMIRTAVVQYLYDKPLGKDADPQKAAERTSAVREQVATFLGREHGLVVKRGLIDVGEAKPVRGHWDGLKGLDDG